MGSLPRHAFDDCPEDAGQYVRLRCLEQRFRLPGVEPDPMAVRTLVDLNAVPVTVDQIVTALRALHVMRLPLGLGGGLLGRRALLAQQLGVAAREILVLVLARLVAHGGGTRSVSPPLFGIGIFPGGDVDSPE